MPLHASYSCKLNEEKGNSSELTDYTRNKIYVNTELEIYNLAYLLFIIYLFLRRRIFSVIPSNVVHYRLKVRLHRKAI